METIAHNIVRRVAPLLRELQLDSYARLVGKMGNETPVTVPLSSQAPLSELASHLPEVSFKGIPRAGNRDASKSATSSAKLKTMRIHISLVTWETRLQSLVVPREHLTTGTPT